MATATPSLYSGPPRRIPNTFTIKLKSAVSEAKRNEHVAAVKQKCAQYPRQGSTDFAGITDQLSVIFYGYRGVFHPEVEKFIRSCKTDAGVVEKMDQAVTMHPHVSYDYTQVDSTNWGLAKVSQTEKDFESNKKAVDATKKENDVMKRKKYEYNCCEGKGSGACIYVLDDGYTTEVDGSGKVIGEFEGRITKPSSGSYSGHGTDVANIAAGKTMGAAPEATLFPFSCMYPYDIKNDDGTIAIKKGTGFSSDAAIVNLEFIAIRAKQLEPQKIPVVVNCSWKFTKVDDADNADLLDAGFAALYQMGVIVVCSAGNEAQKIDWGLLNTPQGRHDVITVGAVDMKDDLWFEKMDSGSNWGAAVTVYAPGVGLPSKTFASTGATGTSFATPLVAGIVACMAASYKKKNNRLMTPDEAKAQLIEWAKVVDRKQDPKIKMRIVRNKKL